MQTGNVLSMSDFYNPIVNQYGAKIGQQAADFIAREYLSGALEKGLAATGAIAVDGTTGADALKQEDLYRQIVSVELSTADHAPSWNWIKKFPCFSDVVQKTTLEAYGGFRRGGFINASSASGGLAATDPTLRRDALQVKWAGGRYQVYRTAMAVRALTMGADPIVGGAEQTASESKLSQLILNLNEALWYSDSAVNTHEPDGLLKQIRDVHRSGPGGRFVTRYNCEGEPLTPDRLIDIERILRSKGGLWTDFWIGNMAFSDLRKQMVDSVRYKTGAPVTLGIYPEENLILDLAGNPKVSKFHWDLMLDPVFDYDDFDADPEAPDAPTTVALLGQSQSANAWGEYLAADTYFYSACAVGINGRSAVVAASGSVTTNGAQKVRVRITNADTDTIFFEIYRGTSATTRKYLGRVSAQGVAAAATADFYDDGEFVPGCGVAIACSNKPHVSGGASFMARQLFPMTKIKLPPDVMAEQAAWIVGYTPQCLAPHHQLVIDNIGQL